MLERTRRRFKLSPKRLAADTAYGTGKFLAFVTGAGIIPHIPVWDKSPRDDRQRNVQERRQQGGVLDRVEFHLRQRAPSNQPFRRGSLDSPLSIP
jgi:hypothetical protein